MNVTASIISKEFVFGESKPFDSCHASTVCRMADGELIVAAFGGTREGNSDVSIYTSKTVNGKFTDLPTRVRAADEPHWNPVLSSGPRGKYVLWFKVGQDTDTWRTMMCVSGNGTVWSDPKELVPGDVSGGRGPVKNPVLVVDSHLMIAGRSLETETDWIVENDISRDGGRTWQPLKPTIYELDEHILDGLKNKKCNGVIQPTLWKDSYGIHMYMRSTWGAVYRSDSEDGLTWCPAYRTEIPNNNSGICCAVNDRRGYEILALCYNPVGENWGARTPLVIDFSTDGGDTFSDRLVLEDTPGEYSYPTIIPSPKGFTVTYTYNRQNVVCAEIYCR